MNNTLTLACEEIQAIKTQIASLEAKLESLYTKLQAENTVEEPKEDLNAWVYTEKFDETPYEEIPELTEKQERELEEFLNEAEEIFAEEITVNKTVINNSPITINIGSISATDLPIDYASPFGKRWEKRIKTRERIGEIRGRKEKQSANFKQFVKNLNN